MQMEIVQALRIMEKQAPVHEWGSATLPDQKINYYFFVFIHLWFSLAS